MNDFEDQWEHSVENLDDADWENYLGGPDDQKTFPIYEPDDSSKI